MAFEWSEFTIKHFDKINELKKEYVNENSFIINKAREEREEILKLNDTSFKISNINIPKDKLIKYASTYWVYDKVIDKLDELSGSYLIEWTNNNLTNKIYIKCKPSKLENIKTRLNILIKVINRIQLKSKKKLGIKLYLVLSDLKKKLENTNNISPKHVNSGYTDTRNNYIFIWREEEFEKVTFHELIHFFEMDHSDENYTHEHKHEHKHDNSLYEAVTDFKGIFYNIIYISLCTNKSLISLFNLELTFIFNQAKMINNSITEGTKLISPAYSYFVLKALLFNYINKLSKTDFEEFWLNIFIKNKNFDKLINKINQTDAKLNNKYYNFSSARMTALELF
jgi:hypothetical protein